MSTNTPTYDTLMEADVLIKNNIFMVFIDPITQCPIKIPDAQFIPTDDLMPLTYVTGQELRNAFPKAKFNVLGAFSEGSTKVATVSSEEIKRFSPQFINEPNARDPQGVAKIVQNITRELTNGEEKPMESPIVTINEPRQPENVAQFGPRSQNVIPQEFLMKLMFQYADSCKLVDPEDKRVGAARIMGMFEAAEILRPDLKEELDKLFKQFNLD